MLPNTFDLICKSVKKKKTSSCGFTVDYVPDFLLAGHSDVKTLEVLVDFVTVGQIKAVSLFPVFVLNLISHQTLGMRVKKNNCQTSNYSSGDELSVAHCMLSAMASFLFFLSNFLQ